MILLPESRANTMVRIVFRPKGSEADEDADGHAAGDGLRRVAYREQLSTNADGASDSVHAHSKLLKATGSLYRTPLAAEDIQRRADGQVNPPLPSRVTVSRSARELAPPA